MQKRPPKKLVYFASLGCVRNLVDSEIMIGYLKNEGYELTANLAKADFLVVNSCAFLKEARDEGYLVIKELFDNKKKSGKVVVAGCLIKLHLDELKKKFPDIYSFVASTDLEKIVQAMKKSSEYKTKNSFVQMKNTPRVVSTSSNYAYLKIAEGCRKSCSFCIIPKIKGPLKSRTDEDVLYEFNALLDSGAHEIILIAQDLGDYGKDRNEKNGLVTLLKKMLLVKKDFWIRLLYVYPDEVSDELIDLIKSDKRICRYIDMPIQHINDEILQKMKRTTSKKEIILVIEKLRIIPDFVIRTSLMVGFPSETDEKFEELVKFIEEHPIDNVGIFKYSKEDGAVASKLTDPVDEKTKQKRFDKLSKIQLKMVKMQNKKKIGKKFFAIIEGEHPDSKFLLKARYQGQAPEVDGSIIINDSRKMKSSKLHEVEITDCAEYDLIAKLT
ncbi:MAG: 30S ribosomal protein S12 methylthiotransferase RimO [Chlamydiae bacterium]|nr:30S ribosomal protein S12 methylthiotransferase RimO [Chlamydiota bacterium]